MKDHTEPDEDMHNAIGKEFAQIGNKRVVAKTVEQFNRVDTTTLDNRSLRAYSDVLLAVSRFRESLEEEDSARGLSHALESHNL